MNVIVFASRKGGSGRVRLPLILLRTSTRQPSPVCLSMPIAGSLTLWHSCAAPTNRRSRRRSTRSAGSWRRPSATASNGCSSTRRRTVGRRGGFHQERHHGDHPARPGVFDVNAVQETIQTCRALRKPYAVVLNGAPARRDDAESPIVAIARESLSKFRAPVWGGQITNRADLLMALSHGEGAREYSAEGRGGGDRPLWAAIERSVKAIRVRPRRPARLHKQAA